MTDLASMSRAERRSWLVEKAMEDGAGIKEALEIARHADHWLAGRHSNDEAYSGGVNLIIDAMCEVTGLTRPALLGQCRAKKYAYPRQLVMYLASERTSASTPMIGRLLGERDHTTIMYGVKRARARLEECPDYRRLRDDVVYWLDAVSKEPLVNGKEAEVSSDSPSAPSGDAL